MLVGMEMEFRDDSRRRKLLVILGLMFAVAAAGAAFMFLNQAGSGTPGKVLTRDVVVAAHDIPARTVIQSSDLAIRSLPDDASLAAALTSVDEAVGRISGVTIMFQQPLTMNLLVSAEVGGEFSILGPGETVAPDSPFWRAVSVNVPDERAVAGVIQVGQRVDLFVTVAIEVAPADAGSSPTPAPTINANSSFGPFGPYYSANSTKITYQDVPVLAHAGTLYTLKVNVAQAEEISHFEAAAAAFFSLALRPEADQRPVPTDSMGVTTNIIVWRYGYPVPRFLLLEP
jgi:Flp pilus assembly protein CpaB